MKKAFIFVLLMLSGLITPGGRGQETATRARSAVPLPSICTPRTSTTAADTIAVNNVYYVCTAPNTWTAVRGLEADHEFTGNNCFKSYAPWADVTCWGARPASWYGISTNTVKMAKGSKILDLSDPGFQNGDGVTIWKAGTAHALPAPAAPTVTPSIAAGGTMSGIVKTTVAGSTTDNYLVIGRTKYGGLTAAGSVGTTPAAQARLGLTTAKITNCTLVLDVITCETSAPTLLAAGSLVHMRAGSNADFTGWFTVDHMNTASEFVINGSILDSRAYGQFYRDAANSVGGTAYYYLGNHLTWTPSVASGTPAWEYYVCAKRAGESFFHLIGQTTPSVPGGWSDTQFDDFGSPFMDKQHYPAYIETVAEAAFNAAN